MENLHLNWNDVCWFLMKEFGFHQPYRRPGTGSAPVGPCRFWFYLGWCEMSPNRLLVSIWRHDDVGLEPESQGSRGSAPAPPPARPLFITLFVCWKWNKVPKGPADVSLVFPFPNSPHLSSVCTCTQSYCSLRLNIRRIKNTADRAAGIINHHLQGLGLCVCVCEIKTEQKIEREREREVKQVYTVWLGVWPASVSARGNWSHKSNTLSDVAVGLWACFTT